MCRANRLSELNDAFPEGVPVRRERRAIQPVTWIATLALMPVLLYDVWQTVQDVKHRHAAAYATAVNLDSPALARSHGLSD